MFKRTFLFAFFLSLFSSHAIAQTIAIMGAMDAEIEKLLPEIQDTRQYVKANNTYYTGSISGKDVVVVRSGVGKVNAAVTTQTLICDFDTSAIIFTGIAGAASPALNVADVVIASALVQHDVDLTAFGAQKGLLDGYQDRLFNVDSELKTLAIAAATKVVGDQRTHSGIIATGDQFIADKKQVAELRKEFEAVAVEMEGAAVAQVADMYGVPLIVIRTVSDKADGSAHMVYNEAKQVTADNSVAITLEMLKKM
ncbi:5'-methylthioadenosine/adenosylhomocysteine nucleosidase [Parasalinivibrio latis]|uniref:5'-methylthioadenosine/adenosylhomocysteine nucleosidase n=1 Tax=Parasalinivibrio latis TaxID=2952610 RepID=UPI0030E36F40